MLPEPPNPNPNPLRIKRPRPSPSSSVTGPIPPCTECGRPFSSMKALFGHMRCHPERQWRGITPPPHFRRQLPPPLQGFTPDEYDVASSLLLLANGPPKARPKRTPAAPLLLAVGPAPSSWEDHHRCAVCDRGFSSGQALGGHMRCHGSSAANAASVGPAAYVLDLNLPPPADAGGDTFLDLSLGCRE